MQGEIYKIAKKLYLLKELKMNLEEVKESRLNELEKKYKPIIEAYNDTVEMVNSIEIKENDSIDIIICKLYILTNNVNVTLKLLSKSEYRINNRKVNSSDISEILNSISKKETNQIKAFAKKQFLNNKKKSIKLC